jgi:hypothetical protein
MKIWILWKVIFSLPQHFTGYCSLLDICVCVCFVEDNEEPASSTRKEVRPEKLGAAGHDGKGDGDEEGCEEKVMVEGEIVATMGAQRGGSCSYHTQTLTSMSAEEQQLSIEQVSELRQQLEQQLASWTQVILFMHILVPMPSLLLTIDHYI